MSLFGKDFSLKFPAPPLDVSGILGGHAESMERMERGVRRARLQQSPLAHRWMMFVDGENLTIRAQQLIEGHPDESVRGILKQCDYHLRDVFLWFPKQNGRYDLFEDEITVLRPYSSRSYYYTSCIGDEGKRRGVRKSLYSLYFHGEVFRRDKGTHRSKGVDIALAKDFLSHAFLDNYDVAVLVAGDADYIPLVQEVKRLGKTVFLASVSSGLSEDLKLEADLFLSLDAMLLDTWSSYDPSADHDS